MQQHSRLKRPAHLHRQLPSSDSSPPGTSKIDMNETDRNSDSLYNTASSTVFNISADENVAPLLSPKNRKPSSRPKATQPPPQVCAPNIRAQLSQKLPGIHNRLPSPTLASPRKDSPLILLATPAASVPVGATRRPKLLVTNTQSKPNNTSSTSTQQRDRSRGLACKPTATSEMLDPMSNWNKSSTACSVKRIRSTPPPLPASRHKTSAPLSKGSTTLSQSSTSRTTNISNAPLRHVRSQTITSTPRPPLHQRPPLQLPSQRYTKKPDGRTERVPATKRGPFSKGSGEFRDPRTGGTGQGATKEATLAVQKAAEDSIVQETKLALAEANETLNDRSMALSVLVIDTKARESQAAEIVEGLTARQSELKAQEEKLREAADALTQTSIAQCRELQRQRDKHRDMERFRETVKIRAEEAMGIVGVLKRTAEEHVRAIQLKEQILESENLNIGKLEARIQFFSKPSIRIICRTYITRPLEKARIRVALPPPAPAVTMSSSNNKATPSLQATNELEHSSDAHTFEDLCDLSASFEALPYDVRLIPQFSGPSADSSFPGGHSYLEFSPPIRNGRTDRPRQQQGEEEEKRRKAWCDDSMKPAIDLNLAVGTARVPVDRILTTDPYIRPHTLMMTDWLKLTVPPPEEIFSSSELSTVIPEKSTLLDEAVHNNLIEAVVSAELRPFLEGAYRSPRRLGFICFNSTSEHHMTPTFWGQQRPAQVALPSLFAKTVSCFSPKDNPLPGLLDIVIRTLFAWKSGEKGLTTSKADLTTGDRAVSLSTSAQPAIMIEAAIRVTCNGVTSPPYEYPSNGFMGPNLNSGFSGAMTSTAATNKIHGRGLRRSISTPTLSSLANFSEPLSSPQLMDRLFGDLADMPGMQLAGVVNEETSGSNPASMPYSDSSATEYLGELLSGSVGNVTKGAQVRFGDTSPTFPTALSGGNKPSEQFGGSAALSKFSVPIPRLLLGQHSAKLQRGDVPTRGDSIPGWTQEEEVSVPFQSSFKLYCSGSSLLDDIVQAVKDVGGSSFLRSINTPLAQGERSEAANWVAIHTAVVIKVHFVGREKKISDADDFAETVSMMNAPTEAGNSKSDRCCPLTLLLMDLSLPSSKPTPEDAVGIKALSESSPSEDCNAIEVAEIIAAHHQLSRAAAFNYNHCRAERRAGAAPGSKTARGKMATKTSSVLGSSSQGGRLSNSLSNIANCKLTSAAKTPRHLPSVPQFPGSPILTQSLLLEAVPDHLSAPDPRSPMGQVLLEFFDLPHKEGGGGECLTVIPHVGSHRATEMELELMSRLGSVKSS